MGTAVRALGIGFAGAVCALTTAAGGSVVVGSAATARALLDASSGACLVYRGSTQPFAGNGHSLLNFEYYAQRQMSAGWITPFLLEVTGVDSYTVVAIGTSHLGGAVGVNSFAFDALTGSAATLVGSNYTFGYQNVRYESDGAGGVSQVASTSNAGVIPFTGYNDFSDRWSYALGADLEVGTVFGAGGVALDSLGFPGRIYSANVTFDVVPAPGSVALLAFGLIAIGRRRG